MLTVGVVIRTLNEAELLGTCLDALKRQRPGFDLDVLVVDSGSTDGTLDIARAKGARIFSLAPEDFDYSKSLNVGIDRVRGELVLVLSAHAIPVDDEWVARMIAPFEDPRVAGVASRQVPWDGAPCREVLRLARTFGETNCVYSRENADRIVFSNAASCIRRSVWREEPFTLPAAEDIEWAQRVVAAGWAVVYVGETAAYHSHDESPRAQSRRLIDITRAGTAPPGPRTLRRTLREASAFLYRDTKLIAGLDEPPRRKLAHFVELVRVASYYVADFSRSGTTAELRREDS
ncbi:MAG: glycosyltransferase family 2 protein [Thermoleophilaceae bacterium]